MLLYNHNTIIKNFVKPQQIALSKSKCAQGMCSTTHSCITKINKFKVTTVYSWIVFKAL